jgi:hypothetical protein
LSLENPVNNKLVLEMGNALNELNKITSAFTPEGKGKEWYDKLNKEIEQ